MNYCRIITFPKRISRITRKSREENNKNYEDSYKIRYFNRNICGDDKKFRDSNYEIAL